MARSRQHLMIVTRLPLAETGHNQGCERSIPRPVRTAAFASAKARERTAHTHSSVTQVLCSTQGSGVRVHVVVGSVNGEILPIVNHARHIRCSDIGFDSGKLEADCLALIQTNLKLTKEAYQTDQTHERSRLCVVWVVMLKQCQMCRCSLMQGTP